MRPSRLFCRRRTGLINRRRREIFRRFVEDGLSAGGIESEENMNQLSLPRRRHEEQHGCSLKCFANSPAS